MLYPNLYSHNKTPGVGMRRRGGAAMRENKARKNARKKYGLFV